MFFLYACASVLVARALVEPVQRLFPRTTARAVLGWSRRRAGLTERRTLSGCTYLDGGDGPALVLLHGAGLDSASFLGVGRYLHWVGKYLPDARLRFIAPDLPGYHVVRDVAADTGGEQEAIGALVEQLHALVLELGLTRVHLAGHDAGAAVAAEYASRYPERVAALVLLAPVLHAPPPPVVTMPDAAATASRQARGTLAQAICASDPVPYCLRHRWLARMHANAHALDRIDDALARWYLPAASAARLALIPATIVYGESDRVLDPRTPASYAALLPWRRTTIVSGAGHFPMFDAPVEVGAVLTRAVREATPAPQPPFDRNTLLPYEGALA